MKTKQSLEKINFLGWVDGTQNTYNNPYSATNKDSEFMAYHNGHNQGSWDAKFGNYFKDVEAIATDHEFIKLAASMAKKTGITAEQWNNNRAGILLMFALEVWKRDNA